MPTEMTGAEKNDKLKDAREYWMYIKEHPFEKKFRENGLINIKYFSGEDQGWDEEGDRAKLEMEKRPALTLNRVAPIIRLVIGSRPKVEATYLPTKETTE